MSDKAVGPVSASKQAKLMVVPRHTLDAAARTGIFTALPEKLLDRHKTKTVKNLGFEPGRGELRARQLQEDGRSLHQKRVDKNAEGVFCGVVLEILPNRLTQPHPIL